MPQLTRNENGDYLFEVDSQVVVLNENNVFAHVHRNTPYMDQVCIEDPTDSEWWSWFRADFAPEMFDGLMQVAHEIGSILLRTTPIAEVEARFDARHRIGDDELNQLLGGDSEPL